MPFTLRPARIADAPSIAHVHVASWRTTYRGIVPQSYLDSLDEAAFTSRWSQAIGENQAPALVAEQDSAIFGFVCGGPNRDPGLTARYDAELYAIYLLHSHQRQGAGRALVQALAAILRDSGHRAMLVWLLQANPAAGFYRRLGAVDASSRSIEIGGATLAEIALGWPGLNTLVQP